MTRVTAAAQQGVPVPAPPAIHVAQELTAPDLPATLPFVDPAAKLSFVPPSGWTKGPDTALNPRGDPADQVMELVRYQLRLADASLYAQPIPLTSGLVLDAKAVLSIGLAREGGELVTLEIDPRTETTLVGSIPGFRSVDEEGVYEGLHTLTRYFVARDSQRRIVARAVASEDDWSSVAPLLLNALASLRADPAGANAPAAPPPPLPPPPVVIPEPTAAPVVRDYTIEMRGTILERAAQLLGIPYVWGGNSIYSGMDCSAWVSRAWDVSRYTTDSIWNVSSPISKEELRPGDAMNLTIGRDPNRTGHIRLFEAWANESHSLVWVYEETPPRAVHRVIAYDSRYQPIRLDGLSDAGVARVIPAPLSAPTAERTATPQRTTPRPPTARPVATPRPTPTRPPTPRVTPTRTPTPTPRVVATARTTGPSTSPRTNSVPTPTASPRR